MSSAPSPPSGTQGPIAPGSATFVPTRKVGGSAFAGAVSVLVIWALNNYSVAADQADHARDRFLDHDGAQLRGRLPHPGTRLIDPFRMRATANDLDPRPRRSEGRGDGRVANGGESVRGRVRPC